jgi:UDP-GlcNAc:undecaprenyl-phosphate GlcNAc-1-phosphate transferase
LEFLLVGVAAIALSSLLTPILRRVALHIGATDKPNIQRKMQKQPVPYLGGVAVSVTVVTLSFLALFLSDFTKQTVSLATSTMLPAMAISALGLIDDLRGLQPWPRLMIQSATAFIVSIVLINSGTLGQSFGSSWLDFLITAIWIVGLCNSINFFDNLDGGASGAVAIISFSIFLIAVDRGQFLVSGLAIITVGATLGFLLWNKFPAKIYLGDAGALFLGVMVAILTIRMDPGISPTYKSLLIPVIFLAVPILDTSVAVTSRIYRGISPFTGGRDHLSHRLMRVGLTQKNAAITLWAATSVFCAAGLGIYYWPDTFGLPLIIGAGAIWIALLAWFLRIPAKD